MSRATGIRAFACRSARSNSRSSAKSDPIRVYDPSGPYTDQDAEIDILKGLPPLRQQWILGRGDVEWYEGRKIRPEDNSVGKSGIADVTAFHRGSNQVLRAKPGKSVTQLAYARAGIVTPEMEYIAIRENIGRKKAADAHRPSQGQRARRLDPGIRHAGIRARRGGARPGDHSREYQSPRDPSR